MNARGDERFAVEADAHGEVIIWRIGTGYAGEDAAVLRESDVKDADLWSLICRAVTG